ncbi:DUF881 domain-containing protein [Dactylosporangium sp. NPDC050688]|uniref:DUF881 domain-containing protein n=1 Tax=Dactylosporangium sp. NPDC050688 TaxID=3157217 RepID=UPI0033C0DB5A
MGEETTHGMGDEAAATTGDAGRRTPAATSSAEDPATTSTSGADQDVTPTAPTSGPAITSTSGAGEDVTPTAPTSGPAITSTSGADQDVTPTAPTSGLAITTTGNAGEAGGGGSTPSGDEAATASHAAGEAATPTSGAGDATGTSGDPLTHDDDLATAAGGAGTPPPRSGRQRGGTGLVIALLVALLGFAISVQFKASNSDAGLAAARPEDLVRILSDLDAQQDRLRREISDLEETRRQLDSGAQGRDAALAEARKRADELGILAGTLPAEGPGLSIEITPGTEKVKAEVILDAVEELRGAGAEAMQINGHDGGTVRVVASTYFVDGDNDRLVVAGLSLAAPYTIMVIGGPDTMRTALNIPGGVVDSVRQHGGTVLVRAADPVRVTALHTAGELQYAKPA